MGDPRCVRIVGRRPKKPEIRIYPLIYFADSAGCHVQFLICNYNLRGRSYATRKTVPNAIFICNADWLVLHIDHYVYSPLSPSSTHNG